MAKIIIGIHGLGNKPPKEVLESWWREAILEGLRSIGHPRRRLKFNLVYWADLLHEIPLDPLETDDEHPCYIEDPYCACEGIVEQAPVGWSDKMIGMIEKVLYKVYLNNDFSINYTPIPDMILRHYFRDLDIYYTKPCVSEPGRPAKHAIRERLAKMLYDYRTHDIFLIAHSMGSIVAYDVLTWSEPRVNIHSWATLGSPLGLPTVMMKILVEQNLDPRKGAKGKTPDSILRNWYNMSDPEDRVALRHQLADEFTENLHGVGPVDLMVTNDYSYGGQTNPHKSYGYLRTPEMAGAICSFIDAGLPRPMVWLKQKFNQWLDRRRLAKERIK